MIFQAPTADVNGFSVPGDYSLEPFAHHWLETEATLCGMTQPWTCRRRDLNDGQREKTGRWSSGVDEGRMLREEKARGKVDDG